MASVEPTTNIQASLRDVELEATKRELRDVQRNYESATRELEYLRQAALENRSTRLAGAVGMACEAIGVSGPSDSIDTRIEKFEQHVLPALHRGAARTVHVAPGTEVCVDAMRPYLGDYDPPTVLDGIAELIKRLQAAERFIVRLRQDTVQDAELIRMQEEIVRQHERQAEFYRAYLAKKAAAEKETT